MQTVVTLIYLGYQLVINPQDSAYLTCAEKTVDMLNHCHDISVHL